MIVPVSCAGFKLDILLLKDKRRPQQSIHRQTAIHGGLAVPTPVGPAPGFGGEVPEHRAPFLLSFRPTRQIPLAERVARRPVASDIHRKHDPVARILIIERSKLGGAGLDPIPAFRRQPALVVEIGLALKVELGIGRAIAPGLFHEQAGNGRGLHFLSLPFYPAVGASDGRQKQGSQDAQDCDNAKQLN